MHHRMINHCLIMRITTMQPTCLTTLSWTYRLPSIAPPYSPVQPPLHPQARHAATYLYTSSRLAPISSVTRASKPGGGSTRSVRFPLRASTTADHASSCAHSSDTTLLPASKACHTSRGQAVEKHRASEVPGMGALGEQSSGVRKQVRGAEGLVKRQSARTSELPSGRFSKADEQSK